MLVFFIASATGRHEELLIVGYSYGCFSAKDLWRFGLWVTVINSALLLLVVQFYWPLIGIRL